MDELYHLDDCTLAFKKAASYYRRKKIIDFFKSIKYLFLVIFIIINLFFLVSCF